MLFRGGSVEMKSSSYLSSCQITFTNGRGFRDDVRELIKALNNDSPLWIARGFERSVLDAQPVQLFPATAVDSREFETLVHQYETRIDTIVAYNRKTAGWHILIVTRA